LGFAIPVDFAQGIASELIADGRVTNRPGFGMQVQPISGGLFVQAVAAGGPADEAGLRPGDVIVEINGQSARSIDPLVVKTLEMKQADTVDLTYERGGSRQTTTLTLSAG
jgi:putative serine protease PepD